MIGSIVAQLKVPAVGWTSAHVSWNRTVSTPPWRISARSVSVIGSCGTTPGETAASAAAGAAASASTATATASGRTSAPMSVRGIVIARFNSSPAPMLWSSPAKPPRINTSARASARWRAAAPTLDVLARERRAIRPAHQPVGQHLNGVGDRKHDRRREAVPRDHRDLTAAHPPDHPGGGSIELSGCDLEHRRDVRRRHRRRWRFISGHCERNSS
jgi:hypothetical protein